MQSVNKADAKNFRKVLERSGLSAREFGETLGISESYVSNILHGARSLSREVLRGLAEKYGVNLNDFIMAGESGKTAETAYIELFRQEAAAGRGAEIAEFTEREKIAIPQSVIAPHRETTIKAVVVRGDSMTGAHIFEGDYVLFNTGDTEGENIFVLSVENTLLVKRVVFDTLKKTLTLLSENPAYPPRIIEGEDLERVQISGKVIAVIHRVAG